MKGREIKSLDKEFIIKRYNNGETINKICISCNVSHKRIKKIVEESGVVFSIKSKRNVWVKEDLLKEAKKYKHRSHLMKGNNSAYNAIHRLKLQEEAFKHMEPLGHIMSRLIYAYEFTDNHVYIGLTSNKDKRHREHMRDGRGSVYKHMNKTGIIPTYRMVSDWYIDYPDAQKLEKDTVDEYSKNGWIVLNTAPAGNLGGNLYKWNEDNLREVAQKYRRRRDMIIGDYNAYSTIIQKGWKHLFDHMEWDGNIEHTLEECIKEAKKFTNRQDFRKQRYDLWQWTYKHKHQDKVFEHMVMERKPYKWTVDEVFDIVNQYEYVDDFMREQPRCYRYISKKSNYREITKNLKRKTYDTWDEEKRVSYKKSVSRRVGKPCTIYNEQERYRFDAISELEKFFLDRGLSEVKRHKFNEGKLIKGTDYYFTRLEHPNHWEV
jgi:hypothetical protein